ncbi:FAD-dependent monooxygenase [Nocardioides pacificus]
MTSIDRPRASVVGAGVGGLASALALSRAGWEVEVLEQTATIGDAGAGIALGPNAVRALLTLGVGQEVLAGAQALQGTALRAPGGRWLSRVTSEPIASPERAPTVGVVRAQLVTALADALGRERIRVGCPVQDPASLEADLVVGADGIHSAVRREWWPATPLRYAGYTAWRALVPGVEAGAGATSADVVATETWGRGERFGIVPVGGGRLYLYATARMPAGTRVEDEVAELRTRFGRWHEPIPQLLEALTGQAVLRHDVHDIGVPAILHRAGTPAVVLVGDSGHAMEPNLGQGAGMALEDAVELAHWLSVEPSREQALARYSHARVPRVLALARRSRQVGHVAQLQHPVLAGVRNAAVALTPARVALSAAARVAAWQPPR